MNCPYCFSVIKKGINKKISGRLNSAKGTQYVTNEDTGDLITRSVDYPTYNCYECKCSYAKCGKSSYLLNTDVEGKK